MDEPLHQLQQSEKAVCIYGCAFRALANSLLSIYTLEKALNSPNGAVVDPEQSPLLTDDHNPDPTFRQALDSELEKICTFYQVKELELYGELSDLMKDEENFVSETIDSPVLDHDGRRSGRARQHSIFQHFGFGKRKQSASNLSGSIDQLDDDSDDDDADETAALRSKPPRERRKTDASSDMQASQDLMASQGRRPSQAFEEWGEQSFAHYDSGMTLKKRFIGMYVSLCELKSFVQLNRTGFTKALKKYDKILDRSLKSKYVDDSVKPAYPFRAEIVAQLDGNIGRIERSYAQLCTKGDEPLAKRELRLHLREHVVWERNTVWREMIGVERKAQAANLGIRRTLLGGDHDPSTAQLQGDEQNGVDMKEISTPVGRYRCPTWLFSSTFFTLLAIIALFVVMLTVPIMERPEQQNCLAMLIFVSLLWATEVIPLFVTSLLIPFLSVVLRVSLSDNKPHRRLDPPDAAKYVFSAMWTPVIMLLLGGFTIAAALSKYNIAKVMATFVLSKAGTKPRTVLLTNMFVAMIASMWISNVASPVLCYSIVQPLLRNLPSESNFSKALILGIALASNIGGMSSPIASPQNIIALENMDPDPSWLVWFFVALPVSIVSILLIWMLLLITFQPGKGTNIVPIRPAKDKFTGVQWFISAVTVATIVLWCVSHQLDGVFGDMGVIAIIPMVLFFGTGILTKEDFNNFLWTIIILAAGGLSLGKAVSSSGLLHTIAGAITDRVQHFSLYGVMVVFAAVILVVATFISHTVAALIILPLVKQVGENMDEPHPNLLVMASALMCSAAMGLPTSGFPNMSKSLRSYSGATHLTNQLVAAIMMEDGDTGKRYLRVSHFLTRGVPSSILTFVVVISLGYGLMRAVGF
jgi:phosphate transporter